MGGARTHRRMEGAQTPKTSVMSVVVSCGSRDQDRWRTKLDLGRRESFDDPHGPTTVGTEPKRAGWMGRGGFWFGVRFLGRTEQMKAKRQ